MLEAIKALPVPKIIAISGFGGSGKSSFSKELGTAIGASVVGIDSFQKNATTVAFSFWETMDFPRLEREVLIPFTKHEAHVEYKNFKWSGNDTDEMITITSSDALIVEGVGLFRPELIKYFDLTVWIDCPLDEAEARGMKRDREVHHNEHDERWYKIWRENDIQYFENMKPKEVADIVLDNSNKRAI